MPVAVKERFAGRPAFATGIYVLGINLGSALSAALAVPIAHAAGSWRWSLAVFSVVTIGLVFAWWALTRDEAPHRREDVAPRSPALARSASPGGSSAIFGSMACVFYGLNNWLPDAYVERGWSEGKAGALLAVLNIAALVTTLDHPLARRPARLAPLLPRAVQRRCSSAAPPGSPALPGGAWVWAAIAGLCTGAMFPLVMTLPVDIGKRPVDVGAVAGLMLGRRLHDRRDRAVRARRRARLDGVVHGHAVADRRLRRDAVRALRLDDARADRARRDRAGRL